MSSEIYRPYLQFTRKDPPRLPLDGYLDLTYRCNNVCRHCWLHLAEKAREAEEELTLEEIKSIVNQARELGCQAWIISGGEPMLREDFYDIFDYITRKSVSYKLNTNGTKITQAIAQLMKRNGTNMVALYGATAEVHDDITRNPGSFDASMRGFAYLREAGARFVVQIVPMEGNKHQYKEMVSLAKSLSPQYRLGAAWLWLSANHGEARNAEIIRQRLSPKDLLEINQPNFLYQTAVDDPEGNPEDNYGCTPPGGGDCIFAKCIPNRRDFHIDPYGKMSFCYYVKDPAFRYDLRSGSFQQAWEEFIPSLVDKEYSGDEFQENCGTCKLRQECQWCGVYAYLEHGRYSAKVDYLCQLTNEKHKLYEEWKKNHIRYYQLGGLTIEVSTDFPITDTTFSPKFLPFEVMEKGEEVVKIQLVSDIPAINDIRLGKEVYRTAPWAIYKQRDSWIYRGILDNENNDEPYILAIANKDYSKIIIYHRPDYFRNNVIEAITTFPSDLILFACHLAEKHAMVMHAAGMIINQSGYLFVGHSGAGKSTMIKLLRGEGEILCDDRIIVRRNKDGFRIYGTWSHGELPDISPNNAILKAIIFLEQATNTQLIPMVEKREKLGQIISHVIKPFVTTNWWEKILDLTEEVINTVPIYRLKFEKDEKVREILKGLK